jgi:hypothetical protein
MKKLFLMLFLITGTIYGNTFGKDGLAMPDQGTAIGGIGADGKFHFFLLGNDGSLNVTPSLPSGAATATNQTSGSQKTQIVNAAGTEVNTGTMVSSTAYEASHVLKASSGTLISLIGYNSKASAQFIQLYNSTTVPADTAVPVLTITVPATSNFSIDVPITGLPFSTGIAVANSSTGATKTLGSADVYFTAVVR